jgi:hypothetical protein
MKFMNKFKNNKKNIAEKNSKILINFQKLESKLLNHNIFCIIITFKTFIMT